MTQLLIFIFSPAKKNLSTAILEKKKAPNKLSVEDSKNDDNTIIEMTEKKMEELKLMRGD